MKAPTILNSKGEPIVLNSSEKRQVEWLTKQLWDKFGPVQNSYHMYNALGYEVQITTLTTVSKKISEQKFYEVAPADYIPMLVGQAPFSTNITTYRSFDMADEFETGIINMGQGNSRLASADAAVDALNIKVFPWAKSLGWTIYEMEFAAKSGNWDLVTQKEKARKRNWDLGVQRVAFLGARGNNGASGLCQGLMNLTGINVNTSVITQPISGMTPASLKTFIQTVYEAYRLNSNRTAKPTHFIIPESDFNGLASQASADFPVKSVLQLLEETFQLITQNKNFKILPLTYGDATYSGLGYQNYTLLNYDEESLKMEIPLDYNNTVANSIDNFGFQNVGMGQFTGVLPLRPLEILYFQFTL